MSVESAVFPPPVSRTRWFRAGLGLGVAGWFALVWSALCTVPGVPWNAARLAPSFALARGLPIYALRDSGAQLGWFYGPVFPLWYLPVAFTDHPTLAVVLAGVVNLVTMLAPFALVLRAAGVARGCFLAAATLVAGLLLAADGTTHAGYYFVHVDIVCVALGAAACVALHRATTDGRSRWLQLAALGAVLAFWTKVLALPLFLGMGLWLWREGHRRLIRPFLFWCLVYGGLVSLGVFACFGAPEVLFDVWYVFARNPWAGGAVLLVKNVGEVIWLAWVWLALGFWAWWDRRTLPRTPLPEPAAALARLLLWAAACQVPLGLAATLKVGASLNSLHAVWYLLLAAMIFFCHRWTRPAVSAGSLRPAVVFALAMLAAVVMAGRHTVMFGGVWTPYRGQDELLAEAKAHRGEIYFPGNPLVTLISERRIYPLDDALFCLWRSGLEPPVEAIWAAVPARAFLVYQEPAQSHFALRYFGAGRRPAPVDAPPPRPVLVPVP